MSSPSYANARLQDVIAGNVGWIATARATLAFAFKWLVGGWLCQGMFGMFGPLNVLGSVVVIGWTYRLMQGQALRNWWRKSDAWNDGIRFRTFAAGDPEFREFLALPNWVLGSRFGAAARDHAAPSPLPRRWLAAARDLSRSLAMNFRIGVQGILCTWALTLVPMLLWQFAWYQGWDNSFNKGYEQAPVGPATFLLGAVLFAAVMFYLPLAQARQAVSGNWRGFFHFHAVRHVIRRRWFACFLLALGYALTGIPLTAAASAIYFLGNLPHVATLDALGQYRFLNGYLFWVSLLVVFPAFVGLRVAAARIYASGMREAIARGEAENVRPSEFEGNAFRALGITERPPRESSLPTRFMLWTGSLGGRLTTGTLCALLWMIFALQPTVRQFFIYQPGVKGYLNHPLVQLPWFHLVPAELARHAGARR